MGDITQLIQRAHRGDSAALDELFQALYPEMRRIAHGRLRRDLVDPDMGTTALVHECYLKLRDAQRLNASDRAHFLSYAASAMRSIIVDIARARATARRGANAVHITLDEEWEGTSPVAEEQILQVHEALQQVAALDARLGRLVEMRYFGGLSDTEIAPRLAKGAGVVGRSFALRFGAALAVRGHNEIS
jgi:RNA polymerase sigma factor (TIGR02999 family)